MNSPTPTAQSVPSNGFLSVMQRKEIQCGSLSQLSALLASAVIAATKTGKKASVTLKLEVQPEKDALNFVTKLSSSLPGDRQPLCIFYSDEEGGLHRDDPTQKELALTAHAGGLQEEQSQEEERANG